MVGTILQLIASKNACFYEWLDRDRQRNRYRERDKQTDREKQTNREKERQIDTQTDRQRNREIERKNNGCCLIDSILWIVASIDGCFY